MRLRRTNGDEKPLAERYSPLAEPSRQGAQHSPKFRLFFKGVPMGLRPADDGERKRGDTPGSHRVPTAPPPNGFSRRMAGEARHSSATVPSFSLPSRPGSSTER
jgi:hypothetical protein